MGAYTGLSKGDVLKFPWSARDGGEIRQGKNDDSLWIPEHSELKKVLDQTPRRGTIVVVNTQEKPYSKDGFPTEFCKINNRLLREGKIGKVLTFHGLLHTVATKLAATAASLAD